MDKVVSPTTNNILFWFGVVACFALPLIGIFDEHQYKKLHGTCAILYFVGMGTYSWLFARALYQHRA